MTIAEQIDKLVARAKRLPQERQLEIASALQEMLTEPYALSADELAVLRPVLDEVRAGAGLSDAEDDDLLDKPWA